MRTSIAQLRRTVPVGAKNISAAAETRVNDLQANIEAGSRLVNKMHHQAAQLRQSLKTPGTIARIESVLDQLVELKACILQQRTLVRELRHDVRRLRDFSE